MNFENKTSYFTSNSILFDPTTNTQIHVYNNTITNRRIMNPHVIINNLTLVSKDQFTFEISTSNND